MNLGVLLPFLGDGDRHVIVYIRSILIGLIMVGRQELELLIDTM